MFSHIVTAARGLFNGQEAASADGAATDMMASSNHTDPSQSTTVTTNGDVKAENETTTKSEFDNKSVPTNGKRKTQPMGSKDAGSQNKSSKRRKRASDGTENGFVNGQSAGQDTALEKELNEQQQTGPAKSKHFRFGSEEPTVPFDTQTEETSGTIRSVEKNGDDDSSDDDDAPETIDNSAQLSNIKVEAKRQEKVKQIEEQLKRDKRRQLDEFHKSQAKSALNKKEDTSLASPRPAASPDDLVSESTATLQGSTTQHRRRQVLPALLPDEILNAAPTVRPSTPPTDEAEHRQKRPNKLKFLDKMEKPPKDVQVGDMTIRVLGESSTQKKSKTSLAPKASKDGRNVKDYWLKRGRSTAGVNGLRRTAGGSSGFVRK